MYSGVSVKFIMVGETNSMVGYHLMTKGHSIQLGSWGAVPPAGPGQHPDKTIILILIFWGFLIKSQSNISLKFLIKGFLIKKQHVYQTYEIFERS